jgi:hypothetical protein
MNKIMVSKDEAKTVDYTDENAIAPIIEHIKSLTYQQTK